MESIKNRMMAQNFSYNKKIDSYGAKIQNIFKSVSYLKNRIQFEKKQKSEIRQTSFAKINHLQGINATISAENATLNKDALKMAEVLSSKELRIQQLMQEVAALKANQFTP
jgi:hypothetical protein